MSAEAAKRVFELGGAVCGIIVWRRVSARIRSDGYNQMFSRGGFTGPQKAEIISVEPNRVAKRISS